MAAGAAAAMATPRTAHADANDLVLARLASRTVDGSGNLTAVTPDNTAFRSLASELGVVLAPQLLTPADTIGFGGFQFTLDATTTTTDPNGAYWRALEGSKDPAGSTTGPYGPSSMSTLGFWVRKGLWFPVPSFEFGVGAVHLGQSSTWAGQFYAKVSLVEGFHDLPLPSLSVRGGVSRLMTQRELDLTVASIDVTVSKHVGVGGTWRFDPYLGYNVLVIIPRSEVIDPTPNVDSNLPGNEADGQLNFVFHDQTNIDRSRVFVGAKLQYYVLQLTLEADFASAGSTDDDRMNVMAKDTAKSQRTLGLTAGLDF